MEAGEDRYHGISNVIDDLDGTFLALMSGLPCANGGFEGVEDFVRAHFGLGRGGSVGQADIGIEVRESVGSVGGARADDIDFQVLVETLDHGFEVLEGQIGSFLLLRVQRGVELKGFDFFGQQVNCLRVRLLGRFLMTHPGKEGGDRGVDCDGRLPLKRVIGKFACIGL